MRHKVSASISPSSMIGPGAARELAALKAAIRRAGYMIGTTRAIRVDSKCIAACVARNP